MRKSKFEEEYDLFQQKNEDAISIYESMNTCLDNSVDEMYKIAKYVYDVQTFLSECLMKANDDMISITDAARSLIVDLKNKKNGTEQYFENVQRVYKRNNAIDIKKINQHETDPNKMIENNLKTIIKVAKSYLHKGIDIDDLISSGNEGLCKAVEKYGDSKWKTRDKIIAEIDADKRDVLTRDEALELSRRFIKYGDMQRDIEKLINQRDTYTKQEFRQLMYDNVRPATFNSVAAMWARAYMVQNIDKYRRVMKVTDNEIVNPIVRLDDPISENGNASLGEIIELENDAKTYEDNVNNRHAFNSLFDKLCTGLTARDKSIVTKYFGLGFPSEMSPKDIAIQENVSLARVSQIQAAALAKMRENAKRYNLEEDLIRLVAEMS